MCGRCCDSPTVTKKDIANIAGHLKIPFDEAVKRYLTYFDGMKGEIKEVRGRCIFLGENKKCTIYKARPLICRVRPYSPQLKNKKPVLTYDGWFLNNCPGLFIGELPVEEEYLKYGETVIKYLDFEENTPEKMFIDAKKKMQKK